MAAHILHRHAHDTKAFQLKTTLDMIHLMTLEMTVMMTDVDGGYVQLVRDLCSWCGLRQVSRRTFVRALEEKGSVMLVPGGQAELVHTWRIKCKKEYVVYGKHKGQHSSCPYAYVNLSCLCSALYVSHRLCK